MTYEEVYDAVVMFSGVLEDSIRLSTDGIDYREIKALAACYELQGYLAGFFASEKETELIDKVLKRHYGHSE